ncbi:hypothetical protein Tco_0571173 [Tanacetum coccineum]
MEHYPHLDNDIYDVVERVMHPLILRQACRPRSDRGKARHSVSSTSAHHNRESLSHQGDDDEDDGASRASTPSPTTYLNSLGPLDYQQYDVPSSSEQNDDLLFKRIARSLRKEEEVMMLSGDYLGRIIGLGLYVNLNMEMEPDIENMTMSEYLGYESAKERRLWDNDSIWEQEDQEEDGDGDTFDMWDITGKNVERIRKFFNVPDEIDKILQPLIPEPIHTTPPNDDYVAPVTKSILDKLLEEFDEEILNVAMINEEADFNPTKDLEELERLLAMRPQSNFTEIQVDRDIIYPGSYIGDADDLLENWMLFVEEWDVGDSEHGLEHAVSSLYQANAGECSILILLLFHNFISLNVQ